MCQPSCESNIFSIIYIIINIIFSILLMQIFVLPSLLWGQKTANLVN